MRSVPATRSLLVTIGVLASVLPCIDAAPITWQAAQDVVTPVAVITRGALVEAVNASPTAGAVTVNGVTFSSTDGLLANTAIRSALSGSTTLAQGLDELLTTLDYGGGTSTVSLSLGGADLVVGRAYTVQVFFTDLRSCCSGRTMTFGDGLGSSVGIAASGGAGSFGQAATGTFTADAGTQTLALDVNGFGNSHITAYQIRSAAISPTIVRFTAVPAQISAGESATLTWEVSGADSVQIDPGIGAVATVGSRAVSPASTQTYTLTASNAGGVTEAEVVVAVDEPTLDPIISEFLASNDANLADADGSFSDWIEIHNPNPFAIDLGGYYLSDDLADLTAWQIPAPTLVEGGGFLVIFASGMSRDGPELHTSFRVAASGGTVALVAPDGSTVVGQFSGYPAQRADISYGIAGGQAGYFSTPTPGAENGTPFDGFVADTGFSIDRGFFEDPIEVEIATATAGATVVHTIDGSVPSLTNGTASPTPASVAISKTTVLRAAAFKDGLAPTNVDTQTYLFPADIIAQPAMDPDVVRDPAYEAEMIPALKSIRTLSIVTDSENLFDSSIGILSNTGGRGIAWERPVSIEFIDPDSALTSFQTDAGLRVHGNGSRGNAKNSLRLLFRADYGAKKLDYPLFGEDWVAQRFNTVVLRAQNANSWTSSREEDRRSTTYTQDTFAKDTQGAMGHPTGGSTFVHLYLNGVYWGMYNPTERPDGGFGEEHFGGDDSDYDAINRRFSIEAISGTAATWDAMITHAATMLDSQQEYEQLAEFIDIDNLIDYMLVHQYMQTRDGPDDFGHNNMRLVRRNNHPLLRLYAWDMEYSMIDSAGTRDYSYPFPIYSSSRTNSRDITDSIASVYIRLKDNNPEFQLRYADRAYQHLFNDGALTEQNASSRWLARADEISSAIICESARWGDQRRAQPYTRDVEWMAERNRLLAEFFPQRPAHVISQLRIHGLYPSIDPPVFSQHGGVVPAGFGLGITSSAGTIYYTLDGSDPREAWTREASGSAGMLAGGTVVETFIPLRSAGWSYLDTGTSQSASDVTPGHGSYDSGDWKNPAFDDGSWRSGTTPLGYGGVGNPPATVPNVGSGAETGNRYPTTYFRKQFQVGGAANFTELSVGVRRDDAAIVYLNGHELVRTNLPSGTVTYDSLASASVNGAAEEELVPFSHVLLPGQLLEGTNVLAVEVHQVTVNSSDLVIDVELKASRPNSGPNGITLDGSGVVRARALEGGEWSALAEAAFVVGTAADATNLVVSELHYHPPTGQEEEEFIELMNISGGTIDLFGARFTEGIEFVFAKSTRLAPSERIVIAGGEFLNGTALSNAGERIALIDVDGATIFDFEFGDHNPWPEAPDGAGPSLTLVQPKSNPSPADPANWRSSGADGGTPGGSDASQFSGDPLADENQNGIPNFVEYAVGASHSPGFATEGALRYSTIEFRQNILAEDAIVTVETSRDLVTWQSGDAAAVRAGGIHHGDGTATVVWRSANEINTPNETREFMRVRVTSR